MFVSLDAEERAQVIQDNRQLAVVVCIQDERSRGAHARGADHPAAYQDLFAHGKPK
jgi:hypothetical protein